MFEDGFLATREAARALTLTTHTHHKAHDRGSVLGAQNRMNSINPSLSNQITWA